MSVSKRSRTGCTLVELSAVVVIIGMTIGLLVAAVQSSLENARRMTDGDNFPHIGLGPIAFPTS